MGLTERDRGELLGDYPAVPDTDPGVSDEARENVLLTLWVGLICVGSVLYIMWLEGAIGGAS